MPTGTIVSSWQDSRGAHIAIAVDESGNKGRVEYIGSIEVADLTDLNATQRKAALVAAAKAARNLQFVSPPVDLNIVGAVVL